MRGLVKAIRLEISSNEFENRVDDNLNLMANSRQNQKIHAR